jgi:YggT family protein
MLIETIQFLMDTLLQPFAAILLLRFHLQWLCAPMRNPLGEFVMLLTNPLVLRARRFIPVLMGLDTATIFLASVVEAIYLYATLALLNYSMGALALIVWTALKLFKLSVYLLLGALLASALLSWINPNTPFGPVLHGVTEPFLRPLRRIIPTAGSFDFSVLALLIILQLILKLPVAWIEGRVLIH